MLFLLRWSKIKDSKIDFYDVISLSLYVNCSDLFLRPVEDWGNQSAVPEDLI